MAHTVVPMSVFGEEGWRVADRDEFLRPDTTLEASPRCGRRSAPAAASPRATPRGSPTAPRRALLAAESVAAELGLEPSMRLVGFAYAGVEPHLMGLGPVPATERVLGQAGLTIDDVGLFELNEPFAVQVLTWCDGVGVAPDDPRLNPNGGAIACGHPLAATGVRLMAQLAYELRAAAGRSLRPHRPLHRPRHGRRPPLGEHPAWLSADPVPCCRRSRRASARSRS